MRLLLAACAAVFSILSGCAPESELSHLDPTLNAQDLRQGKVAVLGVVKFQEPDQVRPPLIAMLEQTFRDERKDLPLISSDSLRAILGHERDQKLLLSYEYQGKLQPAELGEIADSLRGAARYLLLARVEKDRTRNSLRSFSGTDPGSDRPNYGMGITGRDALVAVDLYDLSRRTLAMRARYTGSSENERPMVAPMPVGTYQPTINVPSTPPEDKDYPGAPELVMALQDPFRQFARALPGAPQPVGTPPPVRK